VPNRVTACRCGCAKPASDDATGAEPAELEAASDVNAAPATTETTDAERAHITIAISRNTLTAVAAVAVIALAGIGAWTMRGAAPGGETPDAPSTTSPSAPAEEPPPASDPLPELPKPSSLSAAADPVSLLSTEEIVTRSMAAVVTVETPEGTGTAFFIAVDTLLTNSHVVGPRSAVTLRGTHGYNRIARVDRNSPAIDLAVLKVDIAEHDQSVLPLGSPLDVKIGSEVIAIGSPMGLQNTVTRGIVSAMRELRGIKLIQTDAAINPGNSGGPLLDRYGRVIGVNTLKARGEAEGIGFAVSIHYARPMLGEGVVLKADNDRVRSTVLKRYEDTIIRLAQRADEVEINWKKFKPQCYSPPAAVQRPREWFALSDGRAMPRRSVTRCVSWEGYFRDWATRMQEAMVAYDKAAREAGAPADALREVRSRYNMSWEAWDR
jgi:S1-C subfamily serine protease